MGMTIDLVVLLIGGTVIWLVVISKLASMAEIWAGVIWSMLMSVISIIFGIALVKVITAAVMWEIEG